MIDQVFKMCVRWLETLANMLGISYEAVNVWIFCVLWPIVTVILCCFILVQRSHIKRLREVAGLKV